MLPGFNCLTHLQTAGNNYGRKPSCFYETSVLGNQTWEKQQMLPGHRHAMGTGAPEAIRRPPEKWPE